MSSYETKVIQELTEWEKEMLKRSNLYKRTAKRVQERINKVIPDRIQEMITKSIRQMIQATLAGSEFTTRRLPVYGMSLEDRDQLLAEKQKTFRKTAMAEGAGTGAGGILLGLADFPLLLAIKMRFLFEAARIYGYDTKNYAERIYLLHVFLLAFSDDEVRKETFLTLKEWDTYAARFGESINEEWDWERFQMTYRDHIDLIKMMQMVPGLGAIVGAYANYHFLDDLGDTAKNCFRLRHLQEENKMI
ncbi:EcsC family protein [Alkalihalobacillus sp. AL-G]|uniref:EcsC family protein n=1 Tax=Alkalihalobacillus sp. AL-G TaxID=2926399 RepID=UPI00272CBC0A|nr:EcsC family protein [Alkalihalobacillus sp. AL-G]WLD94087.1 EcsC family protein [Alkalihalobacillus sp. AL-G]